MKRPLTIIFDRKLVPSPKEDAFFPFIHFTD